MHKNDDGSVSFSGAEVAFISVALKFAEELTDQMGARNDPGSENCEDKLLVALDLLKDRNITEESLRDLL